MPSSSSLLLILPALSFAYLLGSVPFGVLISKIWGGQDVRTIGSGNIGATNILRLGRKDLAAYTFILDAFKGSFSVWICSALPQAPWFLPFLGAIAAFLGHLYPIWIQYKGGKGVATYLGCLLVFSWVGALVFSVIWIASAYFSRYSSAAGLIASLTIPFFLFLFTTLPLALTFCLLTFLIWYKHLPNLRRLLAGTERKIGQKDATFEEKV